jgi:hypothetical protein
MATVFTLLYATLAIAGVVVIALCLLSWWLDTQRPEDALECQDDERMERHPATHERRV